MWRWPNQEHQLWWREQYLQGAVRVLKLFLKKFTCQPTLRDFRLGAFLLHCWFWLHCWPLYERLLIMYKTVYHAVIELLIMYEICWSSNDRLLIMDEICLSCNDRLLIMGMICLSCNDRLLIIGMICLSCNDRLLIMEMICLSCNDRLLIMGMICWSCNDRGVDHVWCITKSCHHESWGTEVRNLRVI